MQTTSLSLIILLSTASLAAAEARQPPRPMYVNVDPSRVQTPTNVVSSRIVYVHRCPEGVGCSVRPGNDDSRTDTSSVADQAGQLGEFPHGDAVWNAMFACVQKTFEPFNITVTETEPGNVPHFENLVGGRVSDISSDPNLQNAGGVAPFVCGSEIPNAIVYTFAAAYDPDAEQLCWTSAQEIAHAFGLEHEVLTKDPMTYKAGELPKRFRDEDAECGEYAARSCCSAATQNTYRRIVGLFGPGAPTPPEAEFKRPTDGREIQPGYYVLVHAVDDVRVAKVELFLDGTKVGEATDNIADSFRIQVPGDTALGSHTLEARATDVQGVVATTTVTVTVGAPCTPDAGCSDPDVCVQGVCTSGPDEPGGLGNICQQDTECLSLQCVDAGESHKYCAEACATANADSCPNGFDCIAGGTDGVCYPNGGGGGCCDTSGTRPHVPMLLGLAVGLVLLRRRKRSRG